MSNSKFFIKIEFLSNVKPSDKKGLKRFISDIKDINIRMIEARLSFSGEVKIYNKDTINCSKKLLIGVLL